MTRRAANAGHRIDAGWPDEYQSRAVTAGGTGDTGARAGGRVAVMQPYFLPAPVYFHLVHASDVFVFLDDVQFVTKRWTHRNRIGGPGGTRQFTVPLAARSQNKRIDEIALHPEEFPRWRLKFEKTLAHCYAKAPFAELLPEVSAMLERAEKRAAPDGLAALARESVIWASEKIGLSARWLSASSIDHDRAATGQDRILSICAALGARHYVNAAGGRALYDPAAFAARRIGFGLIDGSGPGREAQPLSILHSLLTLGPDETARAVADYRIAGEDAP